MVDPTQYKFLKRMNIEKRKLNINFLTQVFRLLHHALWYNDLVYTLIVGRIAQSV